MNLLVLRGRFLFEKGPVDIYVVFDLPAIPRVLLGTLLFLVCVGREFAKAGSSY